LLPFRSIFVLDTFPREGYSTLDLARNALGGIREGTVLYAEQVIKLCLKDLNYAGP